VVVCAIIMFFTISVVPSIESTKTEKYTEGKNPLFNYPIGDQWPMDVKLNERNDRQKCFEIR